jgi:hypothetical protein
MVGSSSPCMGADHYPQGTLKSVLAQPGLSERELEGLF